MESTYIVWALSFSLFCHASENPTNKSHKSLMDEYNDSFKPQLETENKMDNRRFGRGSSGPGEGQIDLDMDLNLLLKMNPYERDVRLEKYKKDAFKLLEQDRELFIKSLDAEQRQRFQDIEEKTKKIQYVCKEEAKNIQYLYKQQRSKL
jgi:hypothetical protein